MSEDIPLPFKLPTVARKKVSAAFDGGRITSDGGVMLMAQAECRLGIADQIARAIPNERDADRVVHLLPDFLRARIFAIACGYEDADDLDRLRFDPRCMLGSSIQLAERFVQVHRLFKINKLLIMRRAGAQVAPPRRGRV